mmetsp:Transcript_24560/g.36408  ORF Transcript_24560/g.36408 Transcript_24560/m.36408 type:complete len:428 (-) Transcript_24560:150-1433(-)
MLHFDDNIWFNIYQYYGNEQGNEQHAGLKNNNNTKRSKTTGFMYRYDVFQTFFLLSKEHHASVTRYAQQVPQKFCYFENYSQNQDNLYILSLISWFCRNGVQLEVLDFYQVGQRQAQEPGPGFWEEILLLFFWMLTSCNTTTLKCLKINFCGNNQKADASMSTSTSTDHLVYEIGRIFKRRMSDQDGNDKLAMLAYKILVQKAPMTEYQDIIMDILSNHANTVETLSIKITQDQQNFPFYQLMRIRKKNATRTCTSKQQQESQLQSNMIELNLHVQKCSSKKSIYCLSQTYRGISKLTNLKTLRLIASNSSTSQRNWVESDSLEEIDIRNSSVDFVIHQCKCPSLRVFRGEFVPQKRWVDSWIGVNKAIRPITRSEINHQIDEIADCAVDDFYTSYTLQYAVRNRPFEGMSVPDTCIVLVDVLSHGD